MKRHKHKWRDTNLNEETWRDTNINEETWREMKRHEEKCREMSICLSWTKLSRNFLCGARFMPAPLIFLPFSVKVSLWNSFLTLIKTYMIIIAIFHRSTNLVCPHHCRNIGGLTGRWWRLSTRWLVESCSAWRKRISSTTPSSSSLRTTEEEPRAMDSASPAIGLSEESKVRKNTEAK